MARYLRITTPLTPLLVPRNCQRLNPSCGISHFRRHNSGSLFRSFTSTTMSRCEHEDPPSEYNWISGAETLERYKPGGYHPVMIGDVLSERYCIVDKLGFGGYSTVWLAQDTHKAEYVAMKVGVADSVSQEMNCLNDLSKPSSCLGRHAIPSPLDEFKVNGPNGLHPCYTMAPARCNLRDVSFSRLFPLDVVRALVGGLVMDIAHMHSCGYVHGDIHLSNILVRLPSSFNHLSIEQFYEKYGKPETVPITRQDGKELPANVPPMAVIPLYLGMHAKDFKLQDSSILLSDFGESYSLFSGMHRNGEDCHTPLPMRPPEARFEPHTPLSYSADIWSLAVTIWEILGMKALFSNEYITEDEMVSEHIDVLGPMPTCWYARWEARGEFFDQGGRPTEREVWPELEQAFEKGVQSYRRQREMGEFGVEETRAILNLMRQMLTFQPEGRPTIEEVLNSKWMREWVIPEFQRARAASTSHSE